MVRCDPMHTVRQSESSSAELVLTFVLVAFCLLTFVAAASRITRPAWRDETDGDRHLQPAAGRLTRTLKQLEPGYLQKEHNIERLMAQRRGVNNENDINVDAANNVIYSNVETSRGHPVLPLNNMTSSGSDTQTKPNSTQSFQRLPHAIIIGVKKSGTRALLEFLRSHPDIRAPGPEIHFFDKYYDKGLDWYRSHMPHVTADQLIVEKTPSYFITAAAPSRVHNMSASVRLIVVVRDPVTRAISDFTQAITKRPDIGPFERRAFLDRDGVETVDTSWGAIKIGLYANYLEMWLRYFPLHKIHFVHGEKLISDPAGELAKVQDFLGLRPLITEAHFYFNTTKGFPCLRKLSDIDSSPHCLGKTKGRTHPAIDRKALERLKQFYRPFNTKFYQMTGIDFGWS